VGARRGCLLRVHSALAGWEEGVRIGILVRNDDGGIRPTLRVLSRMSTTTLCMRMS